jgi:hypothetical protein
MISGIQENLIHENDENEDNNEYEPKRENYFWKVAGFFATLSHSLIYGCDTSQTG